MGHIDCHPQVLQMKERSAKQLAQNIILNDDDAQSLRRIEVNTSHAQ